MIEKRKFKELVVHSPSLTVRASYGWLPREYYIPNLLSYYEWWPGEGEERTELSTVVMLEDQGFYPYNSLSKEIFLHPEFVKRKPFSRGALWVKSQYPTADIFGFLPVRSTSKYIFVVENEEDIKGIKAISNNFNIDDETITLDVNANEYGRKLLTSFNDVAFRSFLMEYALPVVRIHRENLYSTNFVDVLQESYKTPKERFEAFGIKGKFPEFNEWLKKEKRRLWKDVRKEVKEKMSFEEFYRVLFRVTPEMIYELEKKGWERELQERLQNVSDKVDKERQLFLAEFLNDFVVDRRVIPSKYHISPWLVQWFEDAIDCYPFYESSAWLSYTEYKRHKHILPHPSNVFTTNSEHFVINMVNRKNRLISGEEILTKEVAMEVTKTEDGIISRVPRQAILEGMLKRGYLVRDDEGQYHSHSFTDKSSKEIANLRAYLNGDLDAALTNFIFLHWEEIIPEIRDVMQPYGLVERSFRMNHKIELLDFRKAMRRLAEEEIWIR